MASPISWLAESGIKKDTTGNPLAGGKVYFYAPGTTIQASVYSDQDKTSILSQPITLDAQGRYATVYTEGPVKMVAYDSTGIAITGGTIERSNSHDATEVEIHNAYFTGTKTDGTTGVTGRTDLNTVLTSVGSSAGGPDGKYLDPAGGTSRALNTVISEIGLSVKSMGAKGDGLTVDTAAFNLAIAAAKAAGGKVVIVPPGTYIIDALLTIDFNGLHLVGAGEGVSIIKQSAAATGILSITGGYTYTVDGVTLTSSSTNTATAIASVGTGARISKVSITKFRGCLGLTGAATAVNVYDCYFEAPDNSTTLISLSGTSNQIAHRFINNRFWQITNGQGIGIGITGNAGDIIIAGNRFDSLATGISCAGGADIIVRDNYLAKCTTAWSVPITGIRWRAFNNTVGSAVTTDTGVGNVLYLTAAGTLAGVEGMPYYQVTGTTAITAITYNGPGNGYVVTLQFMSAGPTVTSGAGLRLTAAFNPANANATLTLVYNGTEWREIARSVF